jgi:hypothetical protein
MKLDRLNAWLQVGASLGLIAGLLLLAVEIHQTRDLTRLQMRLERVDAHQQTEIAMLGEEPAVAWAKSIRDPSSLSDAEAKVIDSFLVNQLFLYNRLARMEKAGLADLSALERTIHSSAWVYFGNPFARRWWRNDREMGGWDPDVVRILDEEIARLDSGSSERWLNGLLSTDGSRDVP